MPLGRLCSSLEHHLLTTALALIPMRSEGVAYDSDDVRGVVGDFKRELVNALTSSSSLLSSSSGSPLSSLNHNHNNNNNNDDDDKNNQLLVDLIDLMLAFRSVPPHAGDSSFHSFLQCYYYCFNVHNYTTMTVLIYTLIYFALMQCILVTINAFLCFLHSCLALLHRSPQCSSDRNHGVGYSSMVYTAPTTPTTTTDCLIRCL